MTTETERGPVRVIVSLTPRQPRLSDEPVLTLTVEAEDGVDVMLPPFGSALGDFLIRDFHEPVPEFINGRQRLRQIYTLEPPRAGSVTVDPLTVHFLDNRSSGDGEKHTVETEPIRVDVQTMIADEAPSLTDLRPSAGPVELPPSSGMSVWWTLGLGCMAVTAAWLLVKRLRRRRQEQPQRTPQELAEMEFRDLIARRLDESDVKEFFTQLTGIVRRYIERLTGIRAPEQTTEEFLREISGRPVFTREENQHLAAFLESADLVKFAGYQPDTAIIRDSTHKAKTFIELKMQSPEETV